MPSGNTKRTAGALPKALDASKQLTNQQNGYGDAKTLAIEGSGVILHDRSPFVVSA